MNCIRNALAPTGLDCRWPSACECPTTFSISDTILFIIVFGRPLGRQLRPCRFEPCGNLTHPLMRDLKLTWKHLVCRFDGRFEDRPIHDGHALALWYRWMKEAGHSSSTLRKFVDRKFVDRK